MKKKELELVEACRKGNLEAVGKLLDEGVSKKTKSKKGESLLLIACKNNDFDMVKLLVERGVKVNEIINKKESALMAACEIGNIEIVEYLLENGANIKTVYSKKPRGRLGFGYKPENISIMPLLIEKGVNIDILDKYGVPLLIAMASNRYIYGLEDIKGLVERGANVNIKDANYGDTPLIRAATSGEREIVKYLIEKGAKIDDTNKIGDTALIVAACYGEKDATNELIMNGANIDIENKEKKTALQYVYENKNGEMIRFLMKNGASLNLDNKAEKKIIMDIVTKNNFGKTDCKEIVGEFYKKGKSEKDLQENINKKINYYVKYYSGSKRFTKIDLEKINKINKFFKEYKITNATVKWNLDVIEKINKSIETRWSKEISKIENARNKERLGAFYNRYKQYQDIFVNVSDITAIEDFIRENPQLKNIAVDIKTINKIEKLSKDEKEYEINKIIENKGKSRLARLRAKIKRIIHRLRVKILNNKVFKKKTIDKDKKMEQSKKKTEKIPQINKSSKEKSRGRNM